jgi:hypothetical protein
MKNGDQSLNNFYDLDCDLYLSDRNQIRVSFACYAIDKFFPTISTEEKLTKFLLLFPCLQGDQPKLKKWAEWGSLIPKQPEREKGELI